MAQLNVKKKKKMSSRAEKLKLWFWARGLEREAPENQKVLGDHRKRNPESSPDSSVQTPGLTSELGKDKSEPEQLTWSLVSWAIGWATVQVWLATGWHTCRTDPNSTANWKLNWHWNHSAKKGRLLPDSNLVGHLLKQRIFALVFS